MRISTLDINEYADVEIARGLFDQISAQEWEEYVNYAFETKMFKYDDNKFLKQMSFKARRAKSLTGPQVFKAMRMIEKMDEAREVKEASEVVEKAIDNDVFSPPIKNVTFRVAWHDNAWNGHVCKEPERNKFCTGFHSLLSERIRKRKHEHMSEEIKYAGQHLNDIEYLPPCFWSINLFGDEKIKVQHDNPAAPQLSRIEENLPPSSFFSWPFAISFTRNKAEREANGSYPANLEKVRIPYFNEKIKRGQSVGFVYANYSNPLSEEESKYLLIGCGLISDKGDLHQYEPQGEIDKIKNKNKKYRNFPKTSWTLRFSFDSSESMVRMPYHEYISYCDNNKLSEDERGKLLETVKVTITEPELEHCFKYVAMDIDDDEAIYLMAKMKQKLLQIKTAGIVSPEHIEGELQKLHELLYHILNKRGHLPGFENLSRAILSFKEPKFVLSGLLQKIKENEEDYISKLTELIEDPFSDNFYRSFRDHLIEI